MSTSAASTSDAGGVDLPDVRRTDRGLSAGKFMAERRRLSREFCHLAL